MSVDQKIQNLIDYIATYDDDEKIQYLSSAPPPQPSSSDIDPSTVKIVVLGCGLVVPPMIEYLNFYGYQLIIATRTTSKADAIIKRITNPQLVRVEKLDVTASNADQILDRLCKEATVIVSLLPYVYHVKAARIALKYKKHFCTTSYISDEMMTLNTEATDKGLLFLNECGVDPGLDHMSAMKVIDDVHENNGKIVSFYSICGGLPAPEFNDNPFGYKFSWAPKGVLLASKNSAKQVIDGKIIDIAGIDLFGKDNVFADKLKLIGNVEWYYNRDSFKYIDIYGIKEISTMIRGTYRYPGWCETMKAIADLKLTSDATLSAKNKSYRQYFSEYLQISKDESLAQGLSRILNVSPTCTAIKNLQWLGLFSDDSIPSKVTETPIDVLCNICLEKLKYGKDEKDMLILKHRFEIEYPEDGWRETRESVMLDFGLQPNDNSSMARTVSLPLAVAIRALVEGRIKKSGVIRPIYKEVYDPILQEVNDLGIKFEETTLRPLLWIRDEVKPGEKRVSITPKNAVKLLNVGFRINIEESKTRCIEDAEYRKIGCNLVKSGSWVKDAPASAYIVGLKELPNEPQVIRRRHIFFAHCYKGQNEAVPLLQRFKAGNGEILDLEYLVGDNGRRVAAFGRAAGMAGMAMGIIIWAKQVLKETLGAVDSWESEKHMIAECVQLLKRAVPFTKDKKLPKVIVIGALGRCGGGSVHIAKACGLTEISEWDLEETKGGGPFESIVNDHDIFVNCIRLMKKIPPFITMDLCRNNKRRLRVIADVACDPNNPNNPVPVYNESTTLTEPVERIIKDDTLPLDVTAIDHLPSLIPLEASMKYSDDLIQTLLDLKNRKSAVWQRARKVFLEHVAKV